MNPVACASLSPSPAVLIVQADRRQREAWHGALVAADFPVIACATVAEALGVVVAAPVAAVVVETPIARALADLMDAVPTGVIPPFGVPPFVLIGSHHQQSTAAPRLTAVARLDLAPTAAAVVDAVRAVTSMGLGRTPRRKSARFHLRVPAARVVKWATWMGADDATAPG
jgi:hypothetical protein